MSEKLAVLGGQPAVRAPLSPYVSIGDKELAAVTAVMRSGRLSSFIGAWGSDFYGGPAIQALESAWSATFGTRHSVSVNSATSGLFAAVGAAGVGPGDEVIVSPYTMSATAMAPLMYGGIPVFVDIDEETFCLDPLLVRQALTPKTKAIIAVNLFGHPAPLHQLRTIADEAGIILIEDNAQGPFACEYSRYAGTIGHIGVFSLNYHKHIHTGEGGICVTDSDELYMRLLMIRNHGENVIEATGTVDLTNLVGANYRMTELSAAVGSVQLEDAHEHVAAREALATALSHGVRGLEGLRAPVVRSGCRHVYYVWAMRYDQAVVGVPRDVFAKALAAEGFPCRVGYLSPLYLLPVFQQRIAIGSKGFPFTLTDRLYEHGMCPVTERMENEELIVFLACTYTTTERERGQLVEAIQKVYQWRHELRAHVEKPLADAAIT